MLSPFKLRYEFSNKWMTIQQMYQIENLSFRMEKGYINYFLIAWYLYIIFVTV